MGTRVASVSCFRTVAGHVASKFDVVHDIDWLYDKGTGHGGMVTRVVSVSLFMTVAGHVDSKCDVVHDIDCFITRTRAMAMVAPDTCGHYVLLQDSGWPRG